jgi:hypothetical protein
MKRSFRDLSVVIIKISGMCEVVVVADHVTVHFGAFGVSVYKGQR